MKDLASIHASAGAPAPTHGNAALAPSSSRSSARAFREEALSSPLISIGRNGLGRHQVVRSPAALRLHRAFNELNLAGWLISSESQGKPQDVRVQELSRWRN